MATLRREMHLTALYIITKHVEHVRLSGFKGEDRCIVSLIFTLTRIILTDVAFLILNEICEGFVTGRRRIPARSGCYGQPDTRSPRTPSLTSQ